MTQPSASDVIEPGETPLLIVRRHWIGLVPTALIIVLTLILVLAGAYALGRFGAGPNTTIASVFLAALLALGAVLAYASIVIFRQNRLIVTNQHIYLVVQQSLASRKVSQCHLEEMQDVNAVKAGVLAMALGFGDLNIETAGEIENFTFALAPDPETLADRIIHYQKQIEEEETQPATQT